jgi:hypothetical protein
MAKKITDFLKSNAGGAAIGAAFSIPDLASLAKGENVLKSIKNIILNIVLANQTWWLSLSRSFSGLGSMVKGLITSTGSLQAAMRKMADTEAAQKQFKALGVSATGAKAQIMKLAKMSADKGLHFEEVSAATQNLIALSRGVKGTAADMAALIDVSKATGASLQDLASNVGEVSAAMRNGDSIDSAVDRLRDMGAISDSAASSLKNLQKAGAEAFSIQSSMDAAMRKQASGGSGGGVAQAGKDRDAATKGLQEAAGKPWVAGDIETTKNYTEALKAITPAIAEISAMFASLFARVGAWTSWLVKTIAGWWLFSAALKVAAGAIALLSAALAMIYGTKLAMWLASSTSGFAKFTNAVLLAGGKALGLFSISAKAASRSMWGLRAAITATRVALIALEIATVILAAFAILSIVVDGIMSLVGASSELAKEMDDAARASKEFNDELMLQANNIETLADKHALLQKAIKASSDAWAAVAEQQKANDDEWFYVSNEGKQKLARKTADAKAIDDSTAKIASAPISKTEIMRHEVEKKLSEEQTARDIEMSKASPKEKVELTKRESKRLAGLAAAGEKEIKLGKEADEKIAAIEYERSLAIKKDAEMGKPAERAARVERAKAGLAEANSAGPIDAWNRKEKVAAAQKELDAANAAVEKGVGGKFDRKITELLEGSDSDILKGKGMQRYVVERRKTANLSKEELEGLSAQYTEGQRLIDRGTKAKNEIISNTAASKAAAEEVRKGKIADKYANKEADAQAELASSMAEGHQAFMQQSEAKLKAIELEIKAYRELHKGVDATTDAYLKNRANAKAAELVAQKFEAAKFAGQQREREAAETASNDTSVGMTRAQNERKAEEKAAQDALDAEEKFQAERTDGKADYTRAGELGSNLRAIQNANIEADKQDAFTVASMNRDIASNKAMAAGDPETVRANQAADDLQAKMMEFRSKGMTDEQASQAALDYTRNTVDIQAGQDMRSAAASAAVSSLAAVGGGGGVEAVDTLIDLEKMKIKLAETANVFLEEISGKKGMKLK